jgi:hypothetical protein
VPTTLASLSVQITLEKEGGGYGVHEFPATFPTDTRVSQQALRCRTGQSLVPKDDGAVDSLR